MKRHKAGATQHSGEFLLGLFWQGKSLKSTDLHLLDHLEKKNPPFHS